MSPASDAGKPAKWAACAILVLFWAAIYLPGLGSLEIRGEEIRRIMPGVTMLQSGNWIVPQFNGQPYLRKPPLVNWAIALSIKAFGIRNEWTARLPSALSMLALALIMYGTCSSWLGRRTALAAALMALASAGLVEKGRLAEIDAIYVALFGMAISCWLGWNAEGRSPWLVAPITGLLLGLGLLAKGPPHLAYFAAIAGGIAISGRTRGGSGKRMGRGAVFAGIAGIVIMAGAFLLWCIPYLRETSKLGAAGVWARQMEQRVGGGSGSTVFINFLRSGVNFLPWIVGLPLFWSRRALEGLEPRDRLIVKGARWPIVACAFFLMLIPGMLPRYALPLIVPYALLLALLLGERALRWALAAAGVTAAGMLGFGLLFRPHSPAREFGEAVNAVTPPGSEVCVFDPGVQPEIFYIHAPMYFRDSVKDLPKDVPCLIAPEQAVKLLRSRFRETEVLAQPRDPGGRQFYVLKLGGRI